MPTGQPGGASGSSYALAGPAGADFTTSPVQIDGCFHGLAAVRHAEITETRQPSFQRCGAAFIEASRLDSTSLACLKPRHMRRRRCASGWSGCLWSAQEASAARRTMPFKLLDPELR